MFLTVLNFFGFAAGICGAFCFKTWTLLCWTMLLKTMTQKSYKVQVGSRWWRILYLPLRDIVELCMRTQELWVTILWAWVV